MVIVWVLGEVFMENLAKKTIELDVSAVKKVRKIFKAKTDKEAVNRALYLVAEEDDIIKTHEALAGTVNLKSPYS